MHARIARYAVSGDAHEIGRRAEEGLLPIFRSQPGFRAYTVIDADGEIFSFSAWDSTDQAEAANAAAASWVAENMADDIDLRDTHVGEIMFSTALGVTTKAGATA